MWPEYIYPKCNDTWSQQDHGGNISLDLKSNKVEMQCPSETPGDQGNNAQYIAGPILDITITNPWNLKKLWKQEKMEVTKGSVSSDVDWAIG